MESTLRQSNLPCLGRGNNMANSFFANTITRDNGEVLTLSFVAKKHGEIDHALYRKADGTETYYSVGFYKFCIEQNYIIEQGR